MEDEPMDRYSVREAQNNLQQLIADARQGKTVFILDEDEGVVQLVSILEPPSKPRKAGSARGKIKMAPDFDAPLADFDEYME
jgi:antitoxin (DNA-binding transcriptional repressor) of toxin-antitoxin stability system